MGISSNPPCIFYFYFFRIEPESIIGRTSLPFIVSDESNESDIQIFLDGIEMMKKSDDVTVEVHFAAKREDKRLMEMAAGYVDLR